MGSVGNKSMQRDFTVRLNAEKVGKSYAKLSAALKYNIQKNLTPSQAMQDKINSGDKSALEDEWTTKLKGIRENRKVLSRYENNKMIYTVKSGNKILLKNGTVEQAANQIAMFYNKYIK